MVKRLSAKTKVVIDTSSWIGFLIGKRLNNLQDILFSSSIELVISAELITEIELVCQRPKLSKYFPKEKVDEFIRLLKFKGVSYDTSSVKNLFEQDPKDSFLFDLIEVSKAKYLVTSDKALIEEKEFKSAKILSPTDFENLFK